MWPELLLIFFKKSSCCLLTVCLLVIEIKALVAVFRKLYFEYKLVNAIAKNLFGFWLIGLCCGCYRFRWFTLFCLHIDSLLAKCQKFVFIILADLIANLIALTLWNHLHVSAVTGANNLATLIGLVEICLKKISVEEKKYVIHLKFVNYWESVDI